MRFFATTRGRWAAVAAGALVLALGACPAGNERPGAPSRRTKPKPRPPAEPPDIPERGPLAQRVLYAQATSLLQAGKAARAVEVFRRAVEADSDRARRGRCLVGLGAGYAALEKHEEAVAAYRRAALLRPRDAAVRQAQAISLEALGRLDRARAVLQEALKLAPDQLSLYQDLAALLLRQRKVGDAKALYRRYEARRRSLVATLGSAKASVEERTAAASALGTARDPATVTALVAALRLREAAVRLAVIRALGQQGHRRALAPLRLLLGSKGLASTERRAVQLSIKAIRALPVAPISTSAPASAPATRPGAEPRTR